MCGRFTNTAEEEMLENRYQAHMEETTYSPHYNISPSAVLSTIILKEEPSLFQKLQWGIKPVWYKKSGGLINVKAETLLEKKTFQKNLEHKRCIIPATGFYEWKPVDGKKQPYYIQIKDSPIFSFAGIWSEDKNDDGSVKRTFAIITTEANELMSEIHNRMPVILHPEDEFEWLSEDPSAIDVRSLLSPYDSESMTAFPVSLKVNNPRNNLSDLINPC
jgi:putative SOS response-associated peptidase YedK